MSFLLASFSFFAAFYVFSFTSCFFYTLIFKFMFVSRKIWELFFSRWGNKVVSLPRHRTTPSTRICSFFWSRFNFIYKSSNPLSVQPISNAYLNVFLIGGERVFLRKCFKTAFKNLLAVPNFCTNSFFLLYKFMKC